LYSIVFIRDEILQVTNLATSPAGMKISQNTCILGFRSISALLAEMRHVVICDLLPYDGLNHAVQMLPVLRNSCGKLQAMTLPWQQGSVAFA